MSDATPNPTPLESALDTAAQLPATTTADGTSTTERSAADLIQADQHLAGNQALRRTGFGLLRQKIRPGDALGRGW